MHNKCNNFTYQLLAGINILFAFYFFTFNIGVCVMLSYTVHLKLIFKHMSNLITLKLTL